MVELLQTLTFSPASYLYTIVSSASSSPNRSFHNSTVELAAAPSTPPPPPTEAVERVEIQGNFEKSLGVGKANPATAGKFSSEKVCIPGEDSSPSALITISESSKPLSDQKKSDSSQETEESIEAIAAFVTSNLSDESNTASLLPSGPGGPGGVSIQKRDLPNSLFAVSKPAPQHLELSPTSCFHLAAVVDSTPATDLLLCAPVVGSDVDKRVDPPAEEVGHCILA